jgi:hypothetical protein
MSPPPDGHFAGDRQIFGQTKMMETTLSYDRWQTDTNSPGAHGTTTSHALYFTIATMCPENHYQRL